MVKFLVLSLFVLHAVVIEASDSGVIDRTVNTQKDHGMIPIHNACKRGNLHLVKKLIEEGADLNAIDEQGATAFHRAVASRSLEIIDLLIANGADSQC